MFRGNLAHTGVYDAPSVPKFQKLKWRFQTDARALSSPAISNGTVYFGSGDGHVCALDAATSVKLFWLDVKMPVFSFPAIASGVAYFGTFDGRLDFNAVTRPYFYDAMVSGATKLFTMGSIRSSPVVDQDVLYFGSADGALYALM